MRTRRRMNETIKELAKEAREYVEDAIELGYPKDQVDDIRDEKFAESIIQECIDIVDKVYDEQTGMSAKLSRRQTPYQEIIDGIEEHFGVEE